MKRTPLACLGVVWLLICACGGPDDSSNASSTYGRVQWLDSDKVADRYSEKVQKMVAAAVVLSTEDHSFAENGYCSGGLVKYRGQAFWLTAAHCISDQAQCDKTYLIPDYEFRNGWYAHENTVLKCERLLHREKKPDVKDFAIATYKVVKLSNAGKAPEPFPLVFGEVEPGTSLMGAGHPTNLDESTVSETLSKESKDWGDVFYLRSGYTHLKKTAHDCTTYAVTSSFMTHDCDTRKGFSGAMFYTYPDMTFAGIHFMGGLQNKRVDQVDPLNLNRITASHYIRKQLDELIEKNDFY